SSMMDWHPLSTRKNLTSCPGSVDHYTFGHSLPIMAVAADAELNLLPKFRSLDWIDFPINLSLSH
ncbi:hypothetical protein V2J59_09850, partial [Pseudomonas alliivorans]